MDKDKLEAIQDQGGGCLLRFDGDGKLQTLIELNAYTEEEAAEGILEVEGMLYEVNVKTDTRCDRDSYETLEHAVERVQEACQRPIAEVLLELESEFNFSVTEDYLGMDLQEIKQAVG